MICAVVLEIGNPGGRLDGIAIGEIVPSRGRTGFVEFRL